ncbi:hypothetical protein AAV94_04370 [Lampropedia cohaerens]|uniref:Histidine kinase/HSP90-like ATPase domain-containing protein n=1 Tax=Lampropedia cohaerens TaxID=1610491 RepID=A0A0U1Q1G6_9BURK|nr:hypothetical protein AAV94_04370 [Lampropedia cohaerens]
MMGEASMQRNGLSIGMDSMRRRVERIGGVLAVRSRPGETLLEVQLPGGGLAADVAGAAGAGQSADTLAQPTGRAGVAR